MKILVLFGCVILLGCVAASDNKVLLCYYGTWATYRWSYGKFDVEHINTDLCTHLVYAFVGINNQGTVISLDPYLDLADNYGRDNFRKFNALKIQNPKLKTLLAVGGWNEGSGKYSVMAADPNLRQNFIQSALKMVLDYGFDGFDLDWEYPARRDSVYGAADINNFSILVKELKEEFNKYGLLLTAAVASVEASASQSYNIAEISKYLDLIGIMSYDMYGAWDPVTGHNAPLHKGEGDEGESRDSLFTVDVAVEYWLREGCPPEKLVVGLALYGRSFTLVDPSNNGLRAPSSGPGIAGQYTGTPGSVGYNEMCNISKTQSNWDIRYDSLAKVPYAVQGNNWVSYDDADSLTKKVEWSLEKKVAGFLVWSIETDDFHGLCGEDFPLLRAINRAIEGNVEESTSTTKVTESPKTSTTVEDNTVTQEDTLKTSSTTEAVVDSSTVTEKPTTKTTTSTTAAPSTKICTSEGFASSPDDCSVFYICVKDINGELEAKKFECPGTLLWDSKNLICNYSDLVTCH